MHSSQVDPPVQREHPGTQSSHVRPVMPAPLPYVPVGHDVGHDVESTLRYLELPQVWHVEASAHAAQSDRHATQVRPVTDAPCSNVPAGHVDLHVARSTARNLLSPQESQLWKKKGRTTIHVGRKLNRGRVSTGGESFIRFLWCELLLARDRL